ncbi:hypothetical protein ACQR1W_31080 [Bradyrhizobium sp. HKCCYLS1011]|uniref:hypothetical protein n=1 Tax=Bradyrhizobium sp. HKCCYLS1011 TaxID=3420733 RepID=UPI003EB6A22E
MRDLYLKVVSIEIDLHDLEGQVANLSFEQRREEALALARAVEQERAQVYAALDVAADRPGDSAALAQALAAAHALASPTFYTLPGRTVGALDRFDPRSALPSFVVAVEVWLAIRASANEQWTDVSRQDVTGFAARLLQITAQMRDSIHCEEAWQNFVRFSCPKPDKGGPHIPLPMPRDRNPPDAPNCVPSPACNHRLSCTDEMNAETNATGKTSDGTCPADTAANARSNRAIRLADYQVEMYETIARRWLAAPH